MKGDAGERVRSDVDSTRVESDGPIEGTSSTIGELAMHPDVRFGARVANGAIALLIFFVVLYPAPAPILFLGAVYGSLSALIATGIVLIYRANRIVNFAQGELGALAGLLGVLLIASRGWSYLPAMVAGLVAAIALGGLLEIVVIRRFTDAPRLILTVATIGLAQLLAFGELGLPVLFGQTFAPQDFPTPFDFTFRWGVVVFRGGHLLTVVVVAVEMAALAAFFRLTRIGIAVRAVAESSERAAQLGIPVRRIGTIVWVLAAGLSASASLLRAPLVGLPIGQILGPALLLRALAAAVIGRMESLPRTFAAAVLLGAVEQAVFWNTGRTVVTDVVLFLVIVGALTFQRRGTTGRATDGDSSSWELVKGVRPIPPELAKERVVRAGVVGLTIALGAALIVIPLAISPSRVNLLSSGLILALVGISLVVLTGWAGEVSLGQMAFFGLGAAAAARAAEAGWDFFACLIAAALLGAVASMVIGIPALRIRGPFLAVTTFSFALATSSFFLNSEFFDWFVVDERIGRPEIFGKFDLEHEHAYYFVALTVTVLCLISVTSLRRSRTGRALLAVRDNPKAAQTFGINLLRARLTGFAVSGFFAALGGGLFAFHQHSLGQSAYRPEESIRVFALVVFGGLGSIPGVLLGSAYFTTIDSFVGQTQTRFLLNGVGLLLVLLIFPGGLGQLLYGTRDRVLRVIARRLGIVVPSLVADVRQAEGSPGSPERTAAPSRPEHVALAVRGLDVSYGQTQVLFAVDVEFGAGEIVALLGTNGAGKSTLLKAIAGSVRPTHGSIRLGDADLTGQRPEDATTKGIVLAPGGRGVFPTLTVAENLRLAGWSARDQAALEDRTALALEHFPVLDERRDQLAGNLSGGEQQMLVLAEAMLVEPKLLMIDELSLGLAPAIVEQLLGVVRAINAAGTTIVLVEQSVNVALTVAQRAIFMDKGEVRFDGATTDLLERPDILRSVFLEGASAGSGAVRPAARPPSRPTFAGRLARPVAEPAGDPLVVDGLDIAFGGVHAVRDVSLRAGRGEIVALIGPNGAGKTTVFDLISGFLLPDSGRIELLGADVTETSVDARARAGLGRSFQDARLFPSLTVVEAVSVAFDRHLGSRGAVAALACAPGMRMSERSVRADVADLVDLLGLDAFANKFISELSTGTRRVVDIACCMAHRPEVLLLDEPSAGIAQRETEALGPVLTRIRDELGTTLLVIDHDMPLMTAIADTMVALDLGRVIATGQPDIVVHDPAVVSCYLGSTPEVIHRSASARRRRAPIRLDPQVRRSRPCAP